MIGMLLLAAVMQSGSMPGVAARTDITPPTATGRNLWSDGPFCRDQTLPVSEPIGPGRGLDWRSTDRAVGHYLLLDRRVEGCSAPLLVSERVPGSNAVGRELRPREGSSEPRP